MIPREECQGKKTEEDGKEKVVRPWGVSKAHRATGTANVDSFPACIYVAQEKPVEVMMDPIDHVRIVGEPFKVTCRVIAPSHKYDIRWVTAAKNVS